VTPEDNTWSWFSHG